MSQIEKRAIATNAVDGQKIRLNNNQSFRARNFANSADVEMFKLNTSNEWEFIALPKFSGSSVATQEFVDNKVALYIPLTSINANSGVCPLDSSGKVPQANLPSYVDDVIEVADLTALNALALKELGKIYVTLDTNKCFRWSGSTFVYITSGAVDSVNGQTGLVTLTQTAIEIMTLTATNISNGYVDLASQATSISSVVPKGFPPQHDVDDFTTSVVLGKTRISFSGDMLSLVSGDKLKIVYSV